MLVKFIIIVLIIAVILWVAVSECLNLLQDAVRRSNIKTNRRHVCRKCNKISKQYI